MNTPEWKTNPTLNQEDSDNKKNNLSASAPSQEEEDLTPWELIKTGLLAILLALLIRTFIVEPFNIPSGSMLPTLLVGDYIFVTKYSYGYGQYSFPFGLANFEGRIFETKPERGDVAVFRQPKRPEIDYIKRIVALPGDRVQMIEGVLYINGQAVPREIINKDKMQNPFGTYSSYTEYRETLPNGKQHNIIEVSDDQFLDNTPLFTVPEDHYFAMGDNRDNSQDSRAMDSVGFIPKENLIGRAEFIFFSTNGKARLHEIWKWPSSIRYNRVMKKIN